MTKKPFVVPEKQPKTITTEASEEKADAMQLSPAKVVFHFYQDFFSNNNQTLITSFFHLLDLYVNIQPAFIDNNHNNFT